MILNLFFILGLWFLQETNTRRLFAKDQKPKPKALSR